MTRSNKFAVFLLAACAFPSAPVSARAQGTAAPPVVSKPAETPGKKPRRVRFQVLHMMSDAIQVQSLTDQREIHTFVYSDSLRVRMQNLLKQGGYQFGDKVKIVYVPGSDIALNIRGKPSKPKTL